MVFGCSVPLASEAIVNTPFMMTKSKIPYVVKGLFALFLAAIVLEVSAAPKKNAEKVEASFVKLDKNEDDSLTKKEFFTPREKWAKRRFSKNGASEDSVAEKMADFKKRLIQEFKKTDSDGNGELSKAEYFAYNLKGK